MTIRRYKDGSWKGYNKRFRIRSIEPNLKKNIEAVLELEKSEGFIRRLETFFPIAKVDRVDLKIEKFGGCWKIMDNNDKVLFLHDTEYKDREREHECYKKLRESK